MIRSSSCSRPVRPLSALFLLASPAAFAGVAVPPAPISGIFTYAPATTTAVPTMSEWGLVAMVLLLAVVAYRALRNHMGGKPLASLVLAGALGLGMASGMPMLRPAVAIVAPTQISLTTAAGGFAGFNAIGPTYLYLEVVNNSGVPQRITGMEVEAPYSFVDSGNTPQCVVGLSLSVGGKCYISVGMPT